MPDYITDLFPQGSDPKKPKTVVGQSMVDGGSLEERFQQDRDAYLEEMELLDGDEHYDRDGDAGWESAMRHLGRRW